MQIRVRDSRATYMQSLAVLRAAKDCGVYTKSSIMLGLGESDDEIIDTMLDLRDAGGHCPAFGGVLGSIRGLQVLAGQIGQGHAWCFVEALLLIAQTDQIGQQLKINCMAKTDDAICLPALPDSNVAASERHYCSLSWCCHE